MNAWLLTLAGAVLAFVAGTWLGHDMATTEAQAARDRAAAQALARYQKAVAQGETDADALRETLRLQHRFATTLDERLRHAPLLAVSRPAGKPVCVGFTAGGTGHDAAGAARGPGVDGGLAAVVPGAAVPGSVSPGAEAAAELPAGAHPGPGADVDDVGLSYGAVSLWNSALAGHDIPAGACRADAPASEACAAWAGVGLIDAWRNHATNAASCAADRARHQALLDHLNTRQLP